MKQFLKSKKALIVVVVLLLAFIGFIVTRNSQQTDQASDLGSFIKDNGRASLMDDASKPSGKEFVFQQLGIVIDQPNGLKGINYTESAALQKNDNRLYVTSDDFKAAAEACGLDPNNSFFASVFTNTSPAYASSTVATVDGKSIIVGPGSYEPTCSGDPSVQYSRVLKASTDLLKESLKSSRPAPTSQN